MLLQHERHIVIAQPPMHGTATQQLAVSDATQSCLELRDGHDVQVLSIYLFHELPPDVRREAAKEMVRVLKPGGMLIITDSIQLGDRLPLDAGIGKFSDFNEPYYKTFIAEDLGKMFMDCGLECDEKLLASSSKALSFRKPM
jgi:ubiquinone/menaquinone biosynthesis C-methylase UbiE